MRQLDKNDIEKQALEIVNKIVHKTKKDFDLHEITINPLKIINNGDKESYYSEIEIDFWKSNNLIDSLSVIIFAEGKPLELNNLEIWLEKEFADIIGNASS